MKPLYLLLIAIILCNFSCAAQEVKAEKDIKLDLTVSSVCQEKITLHHKNTGKFVYSTANEDVELGKEYTVRFKYFDQRDSLSFKRRILIKHFLPSKRQNAIDRAKM